MFHLKRTMSLNSLVRCVYQEQKLILAFIPISFLIYLIYVSNTNNESLQYEIKKATNQITEKNSDVSIRGENTGVQCHYKHYDDDFLCFINDSFVPPERSIYFIETSCENELNARQACAIESAANKNANWSVFVLFTGPVEKDVVQNGTLQVIHTIRNVQLLRLNLTMFSKNSPLEELIKSGKLSSSRWPVSHTSDVARALVLYKYGGVYLDLDILVSKSFENLPKNWVAGERKDVISAGALAFSRNTKGRKLAEGFIRDLKNNFNGKIWNQNGPRAVTRAVIKTCMVKTLSEIIKGSCKDLKFLGPNSFYQIPWKQGKRFFIKGQSLQNKSEEIYGYHVWNHITAKHRVEKNSPYALLSRSLCPATYNRYIEHFGGK